MNKRTLLLIVRTPRLMPVEKLVLLEVLLRREKLDGKVPPVDQIARALNIAPDAVESALAQIERIVGNKAVFMNNDNLALSCGFEKFEDVDYESFLEEPSGIVKHRTLKPKSPERIDDSIEEVRATFSSLYEKRFGVPYTRRTRDKNAAYLLCRKYGVTNAKSILHKVLLGYRVASRSACSLSSVLQSAEVAAMELNIQ